MNLDGLISPESFRRPEYVSPSAWTEHGSFAFWLVDALRPSTIVELGTHWGFSYFCFCQAVDRLDISAKCFAVDTWKGDIHAGHYGEDVFKAVNEHNQKRYSPFSELVRSTFDEANEHFADGTVDLLHIDGRHFYDDVKHDYESWRSKLSDRAVVLFHDTNVRERGFGVHKLWGEISQDFPHFEFLHGHGLGVLGVGPDLPEPITRLFTQDSGAISAIRQVYAQLGSAIAERGDVVRLREMIDRQGDQVKSLTDQLAKRAAELAQASERLAQRNVEIANQATRLEQYEVELVQAGERLSQRNAKIADQAALLEKIRENEISLRNCEASLAEANAQRHKNAAQIQAIRHELDLCNVELARARRRPFRNLSKYVRFKALKVLSSKRSPFPSKMKLRLQRSAQKRDPKRSLMSLSTPEEVRPTIARSSISYGGAKAVVAGQPHILVVSHDASRTGAPIVALNLIKALAERYNVTTLCLRGGEIVDSFRAHSVAVWVADQPYGNTSYYSALLKEKKAEGQFAFAIVNSIESRHVLGALRAQGIASVALLHEFASYTLPRTAFGEAFAAADQVVFSSELTLDNALAITGQSRIPKFHVVAQGKCDVPLPKVSDSQRKAERERLTKLLRPVHAGADRFLVIGAGYVQIRKGVDLFIDVARRVLTKPDGKRAFFAWVGAGYSPDKDAAYSVYLRDQLERAGLTDRVIMLPETSEIEHVYSISNLLLMPGRLDPLPNVAIDAMFHGLPVLCFDKTSGIANLLSEAGLKDECVAEYLDAAGIADRVLNLMRSAETYSRVQTQTRAYATETFQFARYAAYIERLALSARSAAERLAGDLSTIVEAGSLRPDFMLPHDMKTLSADDAARFYVVDNCSRHPPRRPEPGFHPTMYWNALADAGEFCGDAYAEFLRRGRPDGPWLTRVICNTDTRKTPAGTGAMKVALHIHAYYPDKFSKIIERLAANSHQPDLYVSVTDRRGIEIVQAQLSDYRGKVSALRVVPNNGRDIGPLLTEFGPELIGNYDVIGHVHTKRSEALADRGLVDRWTYFLYENVIGGERGGPMLDRIIGAFAEDKKLGIVYAEDPNIMAWSCNESAARELAPRLGIASLPKAFDFPVGTMFWIRNDVFAPFVKLDLRWEDYPAEPVAYDGTMLHAFERLFGVVPEKLGFRTAVTNIAGLTR